MEGQSIQARNEYRIEGDVVWIKLSRGKETCIDLVDWPKVAPHRWWAMPDKNQFRAYAWINKKSTSMHRFLMPDVECVDHIDRDALNNRSLTNLRPATRAENARNKGKYNRKATSRFKGVTALKSGKFKAHFCLNLGTFSTEAEAAKAYDAKALEIFGEWAALNFPEQFSTAGGVKSAVTLGV